MRITAGDVVSIGGLRLTSLARTWCDLAALLDEEQLVAAGDFIIWHKLPDSRRVDLETLERAIRQYPGKIGRSAIGPAFEQLDDHSDSPPESTFRVRFAVAGLPRALANVTIFDSRGRRIATPDLQFKEYKMAFDYEGDHHRTDPDQWHEDIRRVRALEAIGWHVTRGSKSDLRDSRDLIAGLRERLRERGWRG